MMLKRLVKMTFAEGQSAAFLEIFAESKDKIRAMPGCEHLELLRCTAPDNVFFTLSIWQDEAALDAYRQSALFQETWRRTKALFAERAEAWSTEVRAIGQVPGEG